MRSEGLNNTLFLSLDFGPEPDEPESPQRAWLTSELKHISEKGDKDFSPIASLPGDSWEVEFTGPDIR